jgi:sugar lactone lactonase YvrE
MRYDIHGWKKDIVENVPTGRVYRRAADGALTRLMDGLRFANGLVRTRDGKSLIVAETAGPSPASSVARPGSVGDKRGDCGASRLSRQSRR